MPTKVSGNASGPSCWTAPTSMPIATANTAGNVLRNSSTIHQPLARRLSAFGRTAKNFHSSRSYNRRSTGDLSSSTRHFVRAANWRRVRLYCDNPPEGYPSMKQVMLATIVALVIAVPARAELKLAENVTGKGLGLTGNMTSTTYIKGLKMRLDSAHGDKVDSMIFDVENQKLYVFDSKKKEADVWDMADFSKQIGAADAGAAGTSSFKPNGQTKQINGKTATGYDMSIVMPTTLGDAKNGMQMTVTLTGTTWIIKGAPGTADFQQFYVAAADKGFIFTDP